MPARYFSDLTDDQWDRVTATAVPGGPHTDTLRPIVDALLFRERAWCPWSVLPTGLPPADDLRWHAREWAADGTWNRIRRALNATPDAPPAPPATLRRRIARAVRRIPGGAILLRPARCAVQFIQFVRRRNTPHARLPQVFLEGIHALNAADNDSAVERLTQVLELHPTNDEARLGRGEALRRLDRVDDARDEFLITLSLPDLRPDFRTRAHRGLAEAYLLLDDLDRAIGHAFTARLIARFGPDAPWDQDELAEEADEFEELAEAHGDVGEFAIDFANDFAAAARAFGRRERVRAEYARWLATVPAATCYLSSNWVRLVGHTALVDFQVKRHLLGWAKTNRIVLDAPPGVTVNPAYADYYRPFVKVVSGPAGATRHLANALGTRVASLLELPGGESAYFLEGMGAIQEEWERQGRGPLLALTDADRAFGRDTLRRMGVPDGAWFVALHVRTSGFHREGVVEYQTHRNAEITSYLPAIREIVSRGGWVVRLGDATMPPLPPTDGVIDYARGPFKSPRMDVFLCAASRFFVGVASGLAHVPMTFGVPGLLTNWVSNALPVVSRDDFFLPKLLREAATGRVLTFDEWLRPENRCRYILATSLAAAGLRPVDNTPDELREAVAEMLDRMDGAAEPDADDRRRQAAFAALARAHGLVGFARVGHGFLQRHAHLLPSQGRRTTAPKHPAAAHLGIGPG